MTSQLSHLANDLADAMRPVVESVGDAMSQMANSLSTAFAPLLARKKPYETGKELAEITVQEDLTCAERYPVRASTDYESESVAVAYDDGTGFEEFTTYSKGALGGVSDD